jgi:LysR family nitrogen assimilation transcriptional regulator
VDIERVVEMDAMMGTLDLVSKSHWVTIIPALMMTAEIDRMQFSVVPLVEPTAPLDLVVIEPMRRTLSAARARISRNSLRRGGRPQQSVASIFRMKQP